VSHAELSILFFLQLAVVLGACRAVGLLARRVGQPQVVGEMIAGVVLGPSLLGWLWPQAQERLFPAASMGILYAAAQVGIALYMFIVGVDFQTALIRRRLRSAASVSIAGIVTPFALGCVLASALASDRRFFPEGVSSLHAMVFLGAAMSVTAFPVLARIIHERGLTGTSLGTLTLAAGSVDDAAAWCILALLLAGFGGEATVALMTIAGGLLYVVLVVFAARPTLARVGRAVERSEGLSHGTLAFVLMLVMAAAWFTDAIGIHAVFGAFVLGVAVPPGLLARELKRSIEPMTTGLLVPLFFVYSGLNTRLGLVDSRELWAVALVILLAACVGKGVACWLAARLNGEDNREALAIGTLMNARGLMELIILNIGLERGLISRSLFTMMVFMAIATTLAASPLFEWVYRRRGAAAAEPVAVGAA
jgi:Kef-type K+ transport system membrane component KefB